MFTGIIETVGKVKEIASTGTNKSFWIESLLFPDLKVDQSVSHNGVCLTIEDLSEGLYKVTAVKETLDKTNLIGWKSGVQINLERSLLPSTRLDGHFVQGHVDCVGSCKKIKNKDGSWQLEVKFPEKFGSLIIEKGSICLDGVSLTAFDVKKRSFKVAVIPYTWENTNLQYLKANDLVNLEFDLVGKYITRKLILDYK
jgi:riboflavin synthase